MDAEAHAIDKSEAERSARLVREALDLYPVGVLQKNLEVVYVLGTLEFYGESYWNANSVASIYLTNEGWENGYADEYIVELFHDSFASILFTNFPEALDEIAWTEANEKGFEYSESPDESYYDAYDNEYVAKYLDQGFLNEYGTYDLESDLSTFVAEMFLGERKFWTAVENYPRVAKKKNLKVAFYNALDPQFTEEYFRSLVK